MPTVVLRILLFVSSYFPLAVIICLLAYEQQPTLAWLALAIGLLGLIGMLTYFGLIVPTKAPIQVKVVSRQARGAEVMGYIASYIVPFVTFSFSGWQQIASLLIFLFMLGVVYVNSEDMLRVNPMLTLLLRYRLYEIEVEQGDGSYALMTRQRVKRGDILQVIDVGSGIYVEKRRLYE